MDKRRVWREQEQQLVERWNAAAERFRTAQAELSSQPSADGTETPAEDHALKVAAARAELEAVRKQVARMKAEFSNGKRY
jgi:molecular chaperone GrpE (heat shock protein)